MCAATVVSYDGLRPHQHLYSFPTRRSSDLIVQTTTADIARSIRMSHGVVFLHFPKRDDLVIAVIDEFGRRLAVEFRQALEQDLGLRAVLRAHLRVLAEFEPFYARLVTEAPLLPPKVRSTLLMLHAAVSQRLFLA